MLKLRKGISLYGEKEESERSIYWSCSKGGGLSYLPHCQRGIALSSPMTSAAAGHHWIPPRSGCLCCRLAAAAVGSMAGGGSANPRRAMARARPAVPLHDHERCLMAQGTSVLRFHFEIPDAGLQDSAGSSTFYVNWTFWQLCSSLIEVRRR